MKRSVGWMGVLVTGLLGIILATGEAQGVPTPKFVANSYVNLGAPSALQIPDDAPLTVEGWIKFDSVTTTAMLYSKGNGRASPYSYMFGLTGAGSKMAAHTGTSGTPANTWVEAVLPAKLIAGTWYHLAFSFDGSYISFFLDGVCVGRQPYNFVNNSAHTSKIGGYSTTTDIVGNISDVRVWNHPRDADQIRFYMNRRLNGAEPGLLGYWPLNEGSGTVVTDGTGQNDGTFSGTVTWVDDASRVFTAAGADYIVAMPFALADPLTGSTRFTSSNQVDVASLPIPVGCNYYQFSTSGDVADIASGGWLFTNVPAAQQTFATPATDTNFLAYAWFTNTTVTALIQRAESSIFYTTVSPVPAVRATLAIQRLPGQNVIINGADLDAGSTGGSANGKTLDIDFYDAVCANPGDDLTPNESYATLTTEGVYPLLLRLRNEAGNVITATTTCMVTVTVSTINTNLWTGSGGNDLWHNAANWSAGVPAANQNVAILTGSGTRLTRSTASLNSFVLGAGRTLTIEGWESAIKAGDMTLYGTVTHADNDVTTEDWITWVPQHRILLQGSNITVAANAKLDADNKGYRRNQGPGTPAWLGSGAGHAGEGGFGMYVNGGTAYGDLHVPEQPGSGGGITTGYSTQSGAGGGVIRVVASGCLTVLGTIRSNGRNYHAIHGSGGSGGSIWIDCRTLAGSSDGLVQVNGGAGSGVGGGASGGRIALHYNSAAQAKLTEPRPAIRFEGIPGLTNSGETFRAGMGTLSLSDTLLIDGNFTAKRLRDVQVAVLGWTAWERDSLVLNDCSLGLEPGIPLIITNDLIVTNGAILHLFAAPVTNVLTDVGMQAQIGGDLSIFENAWIKPYADPMNGATVVISVGKNLLVAADGGIDADRCGYTRSYGPGTAITSRSDAGNSAGYGGHGGMAYGGALGGPSYGSAEWPVEAGSGAWLRGGGRGGGSIRLNVARQAQIHGTLTAKGSPGFYSHGGGGSGGGILLQCETLHGSNSGLLTVDGGEANFNSSCGGGGRIAIHYDRVAQAALNDPVPPIRFSAYVYPWSTTKFYSTINAQEGTLWLPDTLFLTETLDRQRFWHLRLVIPNFQSWSPDRLTLDDCVLTWPEGFMLTVTNNLVLTNNAAFTIAAAATNDTTTRYGAEVIVGGDLLITSNCWIYPKAHSNNAAIVGFRVERNATLMAGGGIDATGRGYYPVLGNSIGPGAGKASTYSGGGYGGKGGGTSPGTTYGNEVLPLLPGSPAGWNSGGANHYSVGGTGGGVVHLRAGGDIRVDGLVTADGWFGSWSGGSGGSGGAIFLAARRVTGQGILRAHGGVGYGNNATFNSGGGGRIAVWHHLSLAEIERRLATQNIAGLVGRYPHTSFTGELDVGWSPSGDKNTTSPPEEGTRGFYTLSSTLVLLR